MAKPTTYATPICIVLSILTIIGLIWGFKAHNPLIIGLFLLPSVAYEAYRTEGDSTRWASWVLLLLLLGELISVIFKLNYRILGGEDISMAYYGGYFVPLGDIKIMIPSIMIILAIILFTRTIGKYTKWLSILIFASAVAMIYILDPNILKDLLRMGSYIF